VIGQLQAPLVLPSGKELPVSIGQEDASTPEPVWTRWRREKIPSMPLPRIGQNGNYFEQMLKYLKKEHILCHEYVFHVIIWVRENLNFTFSTNNEIRACLSLTQDSLNLKVMILSICIYRIFAYKHNSL